MTAIDTNIVVRFIVADDPDQHRRAVSFIETTPCLLPESVLLETVWVLGSRYGFSRGEIGAAIRSFLGLPNIRVADVERLRRTLEWYAEGLDFADALHLASAQQAEAFATFDRRFITRAAAKGACPVKEP